jgi:hypothetical protein
LEVGRLPAWRSDKWLQFLCVSEMLLRVSSAVRAGRGGQGVAEETGSAMSKKPLKYRLVRRAIYQPGSHPAFPDGLFAEELIFDDPPEDLSRIEAVWDPGTKTLRLFTKTGDE